MSLPELPPPTSDNVQLTWHRGVCLEQTPTPQLTDGTTYHSELCGIDIDSCQRIRLTQQPTNSPPYSGYAGPTCALKILEGLLRSMPNATDNESL